MNNITFLLSIGLSLLLLLIFQAEGNAQDTQSNDDSSYRIVAYAGGSANIWQIEATKITHINYAFANVNEEGEIFFRNPVEAGQQLARLQKLKAKNPDLKLLVSVGGWGADGFSDAALNKKSRAKFSQSAVAMIKNYGLDGIDLDWEFPGQPGPGITYRAEDKQNFTLMLRSLRRQLDSLSHKRELTGDDRYLLTIASNDNQAFFEHTQMGRLHQYLDFINVMAYDMFTVGSETTGHHTGLYQSSPDDPARTTAAAVQRHLDAGIPAHKIVVGVAFYGRSWEGVANQRHGLYQPFEKFYRFIQYEELTDHYINKNGFKRYWDEAAKAPYLWNADKRIMVSYDDSESLRYKADYIKENNLGGVMYWHHSYDPSQVLLDTLYENLKQKDNE
ncbi:MAG TPA: glycoside hydrolase family 18 protein [Fodinibius sp.]|nr:glycoside hydrolase family 18 protein [Fodinibius sp.]